MNHEQLLECLGLAVNYRDRGKARHNRAKRAYALYVRAYQAKTLAELCNLAVLERPYEAIKRAAQDRDAGRPMIQCPELL